MQDFFEHGGDEMHIIDSGRVRIGQCCVQPVAQVAANYAVFCSSFLGPSFHMLSLPKDVSAGPVTAQLDSVLLPLPSWMCRQDYSYLLQSFRFLVTNNFLLDDTAGKPLEFPRALEVQKAQKDAASVEDVLGERSGS